MAEVGVPHETPRIECYDCDDYISTSSQDAPRVLRAKKRGSEKALKLLGVDPSKEKLRARLGLEDDEAVENAAQESQFNHEVGAMSDEFVGALMARRKSEPMINKKTSGKAMKLLGIDPSRAKIHERLGVTQEEQQEIDSAVSAGIEPEASTALVPNKKEVLKACKVLGYDFSREKASHILGIEDPYTQTTHEESIADHIIFTL
jgi:hypothetical protein